MLEELKQMHPESQLGMIRRGDIFVAEGHLDDAMRRMSVLGRSG